MVAQKDTPIRSTRGVHFKVENVAEITILLHTALMCSYVFATFDFTKLFNQAIQDCSSFL